MKKEQNNLPRLEGLFFNVCNTAIEQTSWKFADFEKVKFVQGQLNALYNFFKEYYEQEQEEILAAKNKLVEQTDLNNAQAHTKPAGDVSIPEPIQMTSPNPETQTEAILDKIEPIKPTTPTAETTSEQKKNLISPEEAKKAPVRPMPDDILDLVMAGVEVAKVAPKIKDKVQAKEIPAAETPEDIARNRAAYHDITNDINEALDPGEHYLSPEEAKARRAALIEKRKEAGLEVFN